MNNSPEGEVYSSTEGGIAGKHPLRETYSLLAGSSTSDERNTVYLGLIPIACWRVYDVRFEFDSSFIRPEVTEEMKRLAGLREEYKNREGQQNESPYPPLSVFGHADPTGDDDYNKRLSGRRATAIYALLTREITLWEDLYSHPHGRDDWGMKAIQIMLTGLGFAGASNQG